MSELWEANSNKDPHAIYLLRNPKTYNFLTTWSRGLLEKLTAPQVVKKIPAIYAAGNVFSVFTRSSQSILSSAR
jgi:hypothetical protein